MALRDLKELQKQADALSPKEQVELANYLLSKANSQPIPDEERERRWAEAIKGIESFRGKLPILPDSAFSTEELYD